MTSGKIKSKYFYENLLTIYCLFNIIVATAKVLFLNFSTKIHMEVNMKPNVDFSKIRGVNYGIKPISQSDVIRRDLGYGKRLFLNSVRVWLEYRDYFRDPENYIKTLVNFVRVCHECGYTVMPIIWNGNMIDISILEEEWRQSTGDVYFTAIVNALKDEPGLLIWDLMNEPSCNSYFEEKTDEEEHEKRANKFWDFIRYYKKLLEKIAPDNLATIGHTFARDVEPTIDCVDVISFHDYSGTEAGIKDQFELARSISEKYGIPYMNTETGCIARANPYETVIRYCNEYGCGFYIFELMIEGYWNDIHGIFYPDGTIRDPATIAAFFGCYRNRTSTAILPNPDRENNVKYCINLIRNAMKDNNSNCFTYSRGSVQELLNACERGANLLEACELVPMADPPTKHINMWRTEEKPDIVSIRKFAYELAEKLKEVAYIV